MGSSTTWYRKLRIILGVLLVIAGIIGGIYEILYHEHLYHVIFAGGLIVFGSALVAEDTTLKLVREIGKIVMKLNGLFPWKK